MSDSETFKIRFLGGAGTVTGSRTLIESDSKRILIDCGLFQGLKELRALNRAPFPVDPASINDVILTHAHLDHCGYLPLLVKNGFRGNVYATPPTCDLTRIILLDSARIAEEEAEMANRGGYSKHHPAEPLYNTRDAHLAISRLKPMSDETWIELYDRIQYRFRKSGHLPGSAFVELNLHGQVLAFSGDLGRSHPILLDPPCRIQSADYLVLESTYGDRLHPKTPVETALAAAVLEAISRKGHLLIPTFAVERAQEIMYTLNRLREKKVIPQELSIYLDSPMGSDATEVLLRYPRWHKLDVKESKIVTENITRVGEFRETQRLIRDKKKKIIIAGSGMLSGGRMLEYLKAWCGDPRNTILFVGYQAAGTRGRDMLNGKREIRIHGRDYRVKAAIRELSGFSGHADRDEILDWLGGFSRFPSQIFLNHGEPAALETLKEAISGRFGHTSIIPTAGSAFTLPFP